MILKCQVFVFVVNAVAGNRQLITIPILFKVNVNSVGISSGPLQNYEVYIMNETKCRRSLVSTLPERHKYQSESTSRTP